MDEANLENARSNQMSESEDTLDWRSDPKKSFSDWTIEVIAAENGAHLFSKKYHCHSNVLVWGPRTSDAFKQLFQNRMQQVSQSTATRIVLPEPEAHVFSILLDFMYCRSTMALSAATICPVFLLGERFAHSLFLSAVQAFVEKVLNFDQSLEFLQLARGQRQSAKLDKLILVVNSRLCGYLVKFPEDSSQVSPSLLGYILTMRAKVIKVLKGEDPRQFSGFWENERSRQLSRVVAECCHGTLTGRSSGYGLQQALFDEVTSTKYLPMVDPFAALQLLRVNCFLKKRQAAIEPEDNQRLSSLESRCVQALASGWRGLLASNRRLMLLSSVKEFSRKVMAELIIELSTLLVEASPQQTDEAEHEILKKSKSAAFREIRGRSAVESIIEDREPESSGRLSSLDDDTLIQASSTEVSSHHDRYGVMLEES